MTSTTSRGSRAGVLVLSCLLAACQSSDEAPEREDEEPEPYDSSWEVMETDDSIGKLLADLDASMRAWSRLMLEAESEKERHTATRLQLDLVRRVHEREADLIAELEGGPPLNRARAASALGFSTSESVLSPLMAALDDSDPNVVHNAILGLAILQNPDTPLAPLNRILTTHPDPKTRQNAAYAIRSILEAGGEAGTETVEAARLGLADDEPFVQVHCALILGLAVDADSIDELETLLYAERTLLRRAGAKSLVLIGLGDPQAKGNAARPLAKAYHTAKKKERDLFHKSLVELANENFGDESEDWLEWAHNMP